MIRFVVCGLSLMIAAPALADPCVAPVSGYKPGQKIVGIVRYAGDGDSLCVSASDDPQTWIEIREARWFAPELNEPGGRKAKAAMDRLVGQRAVERGRNGSTRSYDRVVAACSVGGQPIGKIMARAGLSPGGRGR
jgi:micrococcal nuclease